jgi:hypothetical protein
MLCGTAAMKETRNWLRSRDDYYPDYYYRHPIMTPEMIRQLPARRALIIRGGYSPVIARLPMAWNDPAYRKARREHWAALTTTPEPGALSGPGPAIPAAEWPWPEPG